MRKRRRNFASPFVLTVGIGCGSKVSVPEPLPKPEPEPGPARVAAPEPDAAAPLPIDRIERSGRGCVKIGADDITPVNCTAELMPDPLPGELVVGHADRCFRVYERRMGKRWSRSVFDEGEVRCPPAGPNVRLPQPAFVDIRTRPASWPSNTDHFTIDEETLTCRRRVEGNPPHQVLAPCPTELLPELIGLEPERSGSTCTYQGVTVKCPKK